MPEHRFILRFVSKKLNSLDEQFRIEGEVPKLFDVEPAIMAAKDAHKDLLIWYINAMRIPKTESFVGCEKLLTLNVNLIDEYEYNPGFNGLYTLQESPMYRIVASTVNSENLEFITWMITTISPSFEMVTYYVLCNVLLWETVIAQDRDDVISYLLKEVYQKIFTSNQKIFFRELYGCSLAYNFSRRRSIEMLNLLHEHEILHEHSNIEEIMDRGDFINGAALGSSLDKLEFLFDLDHAVTTVTIDNAVNGGSIPVIEWVLNNVDSSFSDDEIRKCFGQTIWKCSNETLLPWLYSHSKCTPFNARAYLEYKLDNGGMTGERDLITMNFLMKKIEFQTLDKELVSELCFLRMSKTWKGGNMSYYRDQLGAFLLVLISHSMILKMDIMWTSLFAETQSAEFIRAIHAKVVCQWDEQAAIALAHAHNPNLLYFLQEELNFVLDDAMIHNAPPVSDIDKSRMVKYVLSIKQ